MRIGWAGSVRRERDGPRPRALGAAILGNGIAVAGGLIMS